MATDFFPGDDYTTPEGIPPALSELFLLRSRWSVYVHFFMTILRSRSLALGGRYDDEAWARSSREIIGNLERSKARFRIEGMNRVRSASGPIVFVSNHMSTLETLALPGLIVPMKPVTYVVKEKLLHGFFWGPIMRSRDPIPVSRSDPRADLEVVLREGCARLAAGISVIVFPPRHAREVFDRSQFKASGSSSRQRRALAFFRSPSRPTTGAPAAFCAVSAPFRRDRPIRIEFGEPMPVTGAERPSTITAWISSSPACAPGVPRSAERVPEKSPPVVRRAFQGSIG